MIHTLFVIQLVSMGAMEMSGPFWPLHLQTLGASGQWLSFAGIAVYVGPMLGIVLTSAFWGRIGDRFGHKLMMVRALLGLALTQLALAFSTDIWTILVLRFLQGACAGYIAPAQAYSVSIESAQRRARLFAYLQVSTNVGSLGGAVAGGLILDHASFFWINTAASVLCAVCAVAVLLMLPDRPAPQRTTVEASNPPVAAVGSVPTWRSAPILGLLGITGMLLVSRMLTQTPFALYVRSVFEASNWVVGLCYGLLALGFVVSASLWARYFEQKTVATSLHKIACIAAGCAVLTVIAGLTRDIKLFIAIHFAWGLLLGATTPVLMALVSKAAGSQRQGYILGIAQSTAQFSSIAGIAIGGWLSLGLRLQYTYFYVAVSYVLALLLIVAILRRSPVAATPATVAAGEP
ncbi:MAG: MFS transporter [Polaromonas sp.]|uniref:MFS transporter n=1 Tax=Polaromonas sp. TaxID=1869339 RepID=UPI0032636954